MPGRRQAGCSIDGRRPPASRSPRAFALNTGALHATRRIPGTRAQAAATRERRRGSSPNSRSGPGLRARFGAGIQHQAPTIDQSIYARPGHDLLPESAPQPSRAVSSSAFGAAWRVAGTVYHRKDRDGFRFAQRRGAHRQQSTWCCRPVPYLANVLTGDTRGAELVLERRSVNGLNGWLSYAWNKSTLSDGTESFPSDYDQRHTVNAYVVYRWSGRTSLSARMRYGSNFPIAGYIEEVPDGYALSEQRNGARLPAYSRLDLRADRTFTYPQEPPDAVRGSGERHESRQLSPEQSVLQHHHATSVRADREAVPVAAGRGSADRVLTHLAAR